MKYKLSLRGPLADVFPHVADVERNINASMRSFGFAEQLETHGEIAIGTLTLDPEPPPAHRAAIIAELAAEVAKKWPRMTLEIEPHE